MAVLKTLQGDDFVYIGSHKKSKRFKLHYIVRSSLYDAEYISQSDLESNGWYRKNYTDPKERRFVDAEDFLPSTDIAAAWEVVEKLESDKDYWRTTIEHAPATSPFWEKEYSYVCFIRCWQDNGTKMSSSVYSNSAPLPLAICRAALLTIIENK